MKKNQKIRLKELKVKSFITLIEKDELVKGGDGVAKRIQTKYTRPVCPH